MIITSKATSVPQGSETVAVIGATSSLAQALCHTLAEAGYSLTLVARDGHELELLASDLAIRHRTACNCITADLLESEYSPALIMDRIGDFDHMILAAGDMGNGDNTDISNLAFTMHINYTLPAQLATFAAQQLAAKGSGSIVIISSVAGDRGRQSNYAYGSAKAALTSFASGLRNKFYPRGVHVMSVKPGFIDTPMTWGMKSPLIAGRDYAAEKIVAAMQKRKNTVYVPFFWRFIMLVIRNIPEAIFKKLKL